MTAAADAAYAALPQAPDAAFAGHPVVPAALAVMDEDDADELSVNGDGEPGTYHSPAQSAPLDGRIRWVLFALGAAVLLPWNAMITATPFFLSRLTPAMGATFSSYLSVTMNFTNLLFLARATATNKQSAGVRRTRNNLLLIAVLVLLLSFSTRYTVAPGAFFAFVLTDSVVQAAAGAYLNTAVMGSAALFGPIALQSVMSGQAAVGVLISAVQLISTAGAVRTTPTTPSASIADDSEAAARSAGVFFSLSAAFLLATAAAYAWVTRLPAYRAVVKPDGAHSREASRRMSFGEPATPDLNRGLVSGNEKGRIRRIARANIAYEFAVAYVFIITLAVFPPITISIRPLNPSTHPLIFSAVHFLLFNVGDLAGRLLCSFPRLLVWSRSRLVIYSLARTLFIPLFLACNLQRPGADPGTPSSAWIASDLLFFVLMLAFGASNGYVSTMGMIAAPSLEHNERLKGRREDVDTAATVAAFCLTTGLAVGSIASFAVRGAVCRCNPFSG